MAIFKQIKKTKVVTRIQETQLFEYVMNEINQNDRKEGIWGQALVASEGDQEKARALYIKLRVEALKDEISLDTITQDERLRAIQMANNLAGVEANSDEPIYLSQNEQEALKGRLYPKWGLWVLAIIVLAACWIEIKKFF